MVENIAGRGRYLTGLEWFINCEIAADDSQYAARRGEATERNAPVIILNASVAPVHCAGLPRPGKHSG